MTENFIVARRENLVLARKVKKARKGRKRQCGELSVVEYYNSLDRIDYQHDHRSLTARVFGDPMPDRSALAMKQHEH